MKNYFDKISEIDAKLKHLSKIKAKMQNKNRKQSRKFQEINLSQKKNLLIKKA